MQYSNPFAGLADYSLTHGTIKEHDALRILKAQGPEILYAFAEAASVRQHYFSDAVHLCSIINIKSGNCSEDCSFCAQSARHKTAINSFGLVNHTDIADYAEKAKAWGSHIGMVTAGKNILQDNEFSDILESIREISQFCQVDASLGLIEPDRAKALKEAGLRTYNHNIETSKSFFPEIVSTHTYDDRVKTINTIKNAGLRVCCGGILGMGESLEDRVSFALELHSLDVDIIPLNFLHPIEGTPLEKLTPIHPTDALKAIAMVRLVNPTKDIKICGGREINLRDLQSMLFFAGATGLLIGDYLTTKGRDAAADLQMIADLGLTVAEPLENC